MARSTLRILRIVRIVDPAAAPILRSGITTGPEASKADKLYGKRFAEYTVWTAGLALDSLGRDYRLYRFVTTELKVFDEKELGAGIFAVARIRRASTRVSGAKIEASKG